MKTKLLLFLTILTLKGYSQDKSFDILYQKKVSFVTIGDQKNLIVGTLPKNTDEGQRISLEASGYLTVSYPERLHTTFFDFRNETVTTARGDSIYSHLPLYHIVDYRQAEYQNRVYLTSVMSKSGANNPFGGFENLESIFGIEFSENKVQENISEKKKKDTVIFEFGDNILAKVHYSSKSLPPQFSDTFLKYLTYETQLHPSVKDKIIEMQKVPDYIEYSYTNITVKVINRMYLQKIAQPPKAVHPLVSKLPWHIREKNQLDWLLDSVSQHLTHHAITLIDSNLCFSKANQLSQKGNNLSAILHLFEYLLQSGHAPTMQIRQVAIHQKTDSTLQKFLTCLGSPTSKEEAENKIKGFRELIALDQEYSYIMNIFVANFIQPIDQGESQDNFLIALQHNPYITGVYIDLGKIYADQYNHANAWQCFEIAFKLNPDHPMNREIQSTKARLKKDFPLYFAN